MNGNAATLLETVNTVNELLRSALTQSDELLTDEQLLELGELNEQLTARTHALTVKTLASIDSREASQHVHGVRTTTWMRERHGYASNHAAGVLREAIRTVQAPIVWQALADATISPRQATAILNALKNLPPDLAPGKETAAQCSMVEQGRTLDPAELAVDGNRLVEVIDPTTPTPCWNTASNKKNKPPAATANCTSTTTARDPPSSKAECRPPRVRSWQRCWIRWWTRTPPTSHRRAGPTAPDPRAGCAAADPPGRCAAPTH